MKTETLKEQAARAAVELVGEGMVVGLGTGSTASWAVRALAERIADGLQIVGIPTSRQTEELARALGVPLVELDAVEHVDVTIDGADEIDLPSFTVIKGFGGALLREKLVAQATVRQVIVGDAGKVAPSGLTQLVPVEVIPFGARHTARALARLGATPTLRERNGRPFVTDSGNQIYDCAFVALTNPPQLAAAIKALPGVVDHGLFINLVHTIIVAGEDGVQRYDR